MKCVNCGCELPDGSKFCIECGTQQPQNKLCPNCKTELPLAAKFCLNCGYNFVKSSSSSSSGISMGDKNVIAGDVTGSKEEYKVTGNAIFIKNEDETKKVVRCHVCFKNITIVNTHTCPICGEPICENCFDVSSGMCISCRDINKTSGENEYKEVLQKVDEDGKKDLDERVSIEVLQDRLGISGEKANQHENVKIRDSITMVEKLTIEDATELFYEKGEVEQAYKLMKDIYLNHQYDEKVLDLYLPILAEYNKNKALNIIKNLKADMITSYLVQIDIYTKSDLSKAERVLDTAERIWNNNLLLICRRINWLYKMYKKTGRDMFYEEIRNLVSKLPSANTKLERTWKERAENISNAGKDELPFFTENHCEQQDIYRGLANSSLFEIGLVLTEEPILLKEGTDGSLGIYGKYVLFGDWPQTKKKNYITIDNSKTYKVNGWDCYKGSDGCYYIKKIAKPAAEATFSNGQRIVENNSYYFKLESIKWRILENNYEGGKLLLAEKALLTSDFDGHYVLLDDRKINGKTICPNNYEYSHIRALLNGLNGSDYDVVDFTNDGFINRAFSKKAIERIKTVTVDNSAYSTTDSGNNKDTADKYICNNTKDKIFLLSLREATNASYGFDNLDKYIGDNNGTKTSSRSLQNTDYCLATGAYVGRYNQCSYWWLRSPRSSHSNLACMMASDGYANCRSRVRNTSISVVPALSISV